MALRLRAAATASAILFAAGCAGQPMVPTPSPSVALSPSSPDRSADAARTEAAIAAVYEEVAAAWPDAIVEHSFDSAARPGDEELLHLHLGPSYTRQDGERMACESVQPALDTHGLDDVHFYIYGTPNGDWSVDNRFCDN